jgi:hypothetical protein
VSFDELFELLEVTIANYNGTPHDGIGARSPLEFLARARHALSRRLCTGAVRAVSTPAVPPAAVAHLPRRRQPQGRQLSDRDPRSAIACTAAVQSRYLNWRTRP